MTHYTVAVLIPPESLAEAERYIDEQMAPYDENIEVESHVCYSREQAASELAGDIRELERILAARDSETYDLDRCRVLLDELKATTPEGRYADYIRFHKDFNERGEPVSTHNPDAKWDWYTIGGRWNGWITGRTAADTRDLRQVDLASNLATTSEALERGIIPTAILTPDGEWHELGTVGWFGVILRQKPDWPQTVSRLFREHPDHHAVIVDAHI